MNVERDGPRGHRDRSARVVKLHRDPDPAQPCAEETDAPLLPDYRCPNELPLIEEIPLERRGLPKTTYGLLRRAARLWPERTAISVLPTAARWDQPVGRTHAELLEDVHRVANLLHSLGVRRHSAVALLSPNCDELLTAMLAAQTAGIAAPVHSGLSRCYLAQHLLRTDARVLVAAGPELDPNLWQIARELAINSTIDTVLVLRPTGAQGPPPELIPIPGVHLGHLSELAAGQSGNRFVGHRPRSSDLAALFHTSGTTGAPKLVAHTHVNEVTGAWLLALVSRLEGTAVIFAALPLFDVVAVITTVLTPLFRGQSVVWAGPLGYRDPDLTSVCWKIVETYRVSAMVAVPSVYSVLARIPVDADTSSFRFGYTGSAPLPPSVRTGFETHTGSRFVEGYGMAEATCSAARSWPDAPRPGAVGQRLPYLQVKTIRIDDHGQWRDLPAGQVGLLALRGPTIFPGYLTGHDGRNHVLDGQGALRDGWLNTGDLGRVDGDGFVHLTGRATDVILYHGHNIDPAVIEKALLSHPAVHSAAAVGHPDQQAGETPVAYVALHLGAHAEPEELRNWAAARVGQRSFVPRQVLILDALPLTPLGKPYRVPLRADAIRRAVTDALADLPDPVLVDVSDIDGSLTATVIARDIEPADVEHALAGYSITWQLESTD